MKRDLLFLLLLLSLAGCATQGNEPESAGPEAMADSEQLATAEGAEPAKRRSELICTNEKVMGSIMNRRVCRTRRRVEEDREAAEDYMRRQGEMQSQGTTFER